jgi:hypothetical protein
MTTTEELSELFQNLASPRPSDAMDVIADIGLFDYPADLTRLLEADLNQNVRAAPAGVLSFP